MEKLKQITLFAFMTILFSCSEDTPDFSGTFQLALIKDVCTDTSNNGQITRSADGVCLQIDDKVQCSDYTMTISADGSYSLSSETVEVIGGVRFSTPPSTREGTYITRDRMITFSGEFSATMELDENETRLNWIIVAENSLGCTRSYDLNRTF